MRRTAGWLGAVPVVPAAVLALALVALSGCGPRGGATAAEPESTSAVGAFRACPSSASASPMAEGGAKLVPDLSLPCLVGGQSVALRRLGQPAVINLWASWCSPCRAELPAFQRLADSADGKVLVLGVVTGDTVSASSSLAVDLGVTFPALFDSPGELRRAVGPQGLPVTLFVDASGVVRHVDTSGELALPALRDLVRQHLGVVLPEAGV